MCINLGFSVVSSGFVSVTIAKSFFRMTLFFLVLVSSVFMWGVYFVMVSSGIIFHCGFNVPRGSGTFRAIVLRATFFLLYTTVDVLSPKVISRRLGIILPRTRVWLSSGAFSESSESELRAGCDYVMYWISSSGSESLS